MTMKFRPRRLARTLTLLGAGLALTAAVAQPGAARQMSFPGGAGQIAFTRSSVLYTVNPDGSGARAVKVPQNVRPFDPAWSADGLWLTYVTFGIWIQKRDGTGAKQLTKDTNDSNPTWAPDGKRIAFVRQIGSRARLLLMSADGTGITNITANFNQSVRDPEWSPDGNRIAFTDGFSVYVVNADGSQLKSLAAGKNPTWSPDGSRVAYVTLNTVRVVGADGSGDRQLAAGFRELWEISWSPAGSQIAFVNDPGGAGSTFQEELFMVNADGSNIRRLNVDTDTTVDWGRATCLVPNVKGKLLAAAETALGRASCSLGSVKQVFSTKVKKGRVISQKPAARTYTLEGTKVSLVVSKGKKK